MAVQTGERTRAAVELFAERAARGVADAPTLEDAADAIVAAAAAATGAQAVVARVLDASEGRLRACSVAAASLSLAAELEGSLLPVGEVPEEESTEPTSALLRVAERAGTPYALVVPVRVGGAVAATLELLRSHGEFGPGDRRIVRLAASELALAVRAFAVLARAGAAPGLAEQLEVAGDALAAGADEERAAEHVVRVVVETTGARACLLWRVDEGVAPALLARHGEDGHAAGADAVE